MVFQNITKEKDMKKVIITIIMIVIVFECIPIISKAIYGEEQKVFNAMPGDVVVGTDENGKFITKPHDTGSVVKSADNTMIQRALVLSLITALIVAIVITAFYKLKIYDSKKDIVLCLLMIIVLIARAIMIACNTILIAY
jgi:hypothetical protein